MLKRTIWHFKVTLVHYVLPYVIMYVKENDLAFQGHVRSLCWHVFWYKVFKTRLDLSHKCTSEHIFAVFSLAKLFTEFLLHQVMSLPVCQVPYYYSLATKTNSLEVWGTNETQKLRNPFVFGTESFAVQMQMEAAKLQNNNILERTLKEGNIRGCLEACLNV